MAKNNPLLKKKQLTPRLMDIVGRKPLEQTKVVKKLWAYIKKNKLQNPKKKTEILPDEKLFRLFGTKKPISMFSMMKLLQKHMR